MAKGKFVVVDGNEGAGKSTMMEEARKHFGQSVFLTREIGGSPLAEIIRHQMFSTEEGKQADAKTLFNLAWAARADHLKNIIKPNLDRGVNVISDRFDSSTYAYQIFAQDGEDLKELFKIEREVILGDYEPDLYILLDVLPENGMKRKEAQTDHQFDNFDRQSLDFYQKVRNGFTEFFKDVPNKVIDANKPLEEVKVNFLEILEEVFRKSVL